MSFVDDFASIAKDLDTRRADKFEPSDRLKEMVAKYGDYALKQPEDDPAGWVHPIYPIGYVESFRAYARHISDCT